MTTATVVAHSRFADGPELVSVFVTAPQQEASILAKYIPLSIRLNVHRLRLDLCRNLPKVSPSADELPNEAAIKAFERIQTNVFDLTKDVESNEFSRRLIAPFIEHSVLASFVLDHWHFNKHLLPEGLVKNIDAAIYNSCAENTTEWHLPFIGSEHWGGCHSATTLRKASMIQCGYVEYGDPRYVQCDIGAWAELYDRLCDSSKEQLCNGTKRHVTRMVDVYHALKL